MSGRHHLLSGSTRILQGAKADYNGVSNKLFGSQLAKAFIFLTVGFASMVLVIYLGVYHSSHPAIQKVPSTAEDYQNDIQKRIAANIKSENIVHNLRMFTWEPHPAGTEANFRVANKIAQLWEMNGLESGCIISCIVLALSLDVHFDEFDVLLSYPDYEKPNTVSIINNDGEVTFSTVGISKAILPTEQGAPGAGVQWVAYSENGTVQGDIIYCNKGTDDDFDYLLQQGISVKGKMVMIRYGGGFRGDKVRNAETRGATGVILYSDPADVARSGTEEGDVYPNTEWMPAGGVQQGDKGILKKCLQHIQVQRGTLLMGDGDPLTPIYPSKKYTYRSRSIEKAKIDRILPTIPVIPMSYGDAGRLLSKLKGRKAPDEWQGELNLTYRFGPGFHDGHQVRMTVRTTLLKRTIRNVIGYIKGSQEPDRYVLLGNHYDAWVYGSVDPNSATAVLTEIAGAMVKVKNDHGWKPSRTVVFCAWDAEELGLIGSTEWVQEHSQLLSRRAVVYLNVDNIHGNRSLYAFATPTVYQVISSAAKKIVNPVQSEVKMGRNTVFDSWVYHFPGRPPRSSDIPYTPLPTGGSDHASFINYLGIPVVDFGFRNLTWKDNYPLYHSLYETHYLNEKIIDNDHFAIHVAVGQYWAELARMFADSAILPLNATDLARSLLLEYLPQLRLTINNSKHRPEMGLIIHQLNELNRAAVRFANSTVIFAGESSNAMELFGRNPFDSRPIDAINERLMAVDRCFINPRGQGEQAQSRHVLFSVSSKNEYSGRTMAEVYDLLDQMNELGSQSKRAVLCGRVAEQISIVQYSVECAINNMADFV